MVIKLCKSLKLQNTTKHEIVSKVIASISKVQSECVYIRLNTSKLTNLCDQRQLLNFIRCSLPMIKFLWFCEGMSVQSYSWVQQIPKINWNTKNTYQNWISACKIWFWRPAAEIKAWCEGGAKGAKGFAKGLGLGAKGGAKGANGGAKGDAKAAKDGGKVQVLVSRLDHVTHQKLKKTEKNLLSQHGASYLTKDFKAPAYSWCSEAFQS